MSSQIPGYQVIRKIGEGGMSTVYLAIQLSVGREVALKVLSPELRTDPTFAERFYREANIVGRLSHPNIIAIYDIGRHGKHYYMAMDYLPGATCKQLIRNQQMTPVRALSIMRDINNALEYSHQQGYLHCDIKPENIMFRADGSAVLTDFGIARDMHEDTSSSTIAGTPHYMSPEQAQGARLDKSADIYSLGILFYEMLTGLPPYHGKDAISVALKHVSAPVPQLPAELAVFQSFLQRMLAKRPGARFQNCNEMKHAIDFFEAQYLRKESGRLPLKLQAQLLLQTLQNRSKQLAGLVKHLRFSLRHGLILKLVDSDFDLPDVERISKTIETTHQTAANTGRHLLNDPIAIALETQQARQLAPTWMVMTLLFSICLATVYIISNDILSNYLNSIGNPRIIYVD